MLLIIIFFFFFNDTATTEIYTLSLHDALPISAFLHQGFDIVPLSARKRHRSRLLLGIPIPRPRGRPTGKQARHSERSEEHTSELQSPCNLVCRLLLEKKKRCPTADLRSHV